MTWTVGLVVLAIVAGCRTGMAPEPTRAPAASARPVEVTPAPVSCAYPAEEPIPTFPAGVSPAASGLLGLFREAPIVAMGEYHGWKAEHDVLAEVVCDPAFPTLVDAVVVEFGNSRLQAIIDRYVVAGEDVSRTELQSVWRESTQRSGVWDDPVYERFFGLVRHVNATLPVEQRVRVLAGDPPIDYATVTSFNECSSDDPSCFDYWIQRRDEAYAEVVDAEVLANGETAMLIAGVGHMVRRHDGERPPSIPDLLERIAPGSTRVVIPHRSFGTADPDSEARIRAWPTPALATLANSWLGELDACLLEGESAGPGEPQCPDGSGPTLSDVADAYLYLGSG